MKNIEGVEKFQDFVNCHSCSKKSRPYEVDYRKSDCPCLVESMGVIDGHSINQSTMPFNEWVSRSIANDHSITPSTTNK